MYTGAVHVAGPPDIRELPRLRITKIAVGPMANNAYLLRCLMTGDALLIDAAAEPGRLTALWGPAPPSAVLTTHRHRDHWGALAEIVTATGAMTVSGAHDAEGIDVPTDLRVGHGEIVRVGEAELEVIELVGHTPGSIALLYQDPGGIAHAFVGDCLFRGESGPRGAIRWRSSGCSAMSRAGCSTGCPTALGCTPGMVPTPRSVPSARAWPPGESGAGDREAAPGSSGSGWTTSDRHLTGFPVTPIAPPWRVRDSAPRQQAQCPRRRRRREGTSSGTRPRVAAAPGGRSAPSA